MKCYYHEATDAVGLCKSCGRGLCKGCAVDLGRGLACRDRCEGHARGVIELVESNVRYLPTHRSLVVGARRTGIIAAGFFMAMGVVMLWWGVRNDDVFGFIGLVGIGFLIFGVIHLVRMLRVTPVPMLTSPGPGAT